MPDSSHTAILPGRQVVLHGNSDDPYFRNAGAVLAAEAPLQAWVRANLPRDAVVVDIGGNIGLTALILSALLPDGHVHVFEALPENAAFLRRNIAENGIRNVTVNSVALGRQPGSVQMGAAGAGSHVQSGGQGVEVPMTTLDRYVAEAGLARLDFIKMDVEGFEPPVLDGAAATIERFRPPVFMEFNTWCLTFVQGLDARGFAALLWDAFEVLSVDASGAERPAGPDPYSFFHDNVVLHGTNEDVLLRLRPEAQVPSMDGLVRSGSGVVAQLELKQAHLGLKRVEAELDAIRRSTSWQVTGPLRTLVNRWRR